MRLVRRRCGTVRRAARPAPRPRARKRAIASRPQRRTSATVPSWRTLAPDEDRDAVAERLGLAQVVRGEQDRLACHGASARSAMNSRSVDRGRGVEAARRLVHEQDRRIVQQRPRDRHALLHPRGVVGKRPVGGLGQVDALRAAPRTRDSVRGTGRRTVERRTAGSRGRTGASRTSARRSGRGRSDA